MCMGTPMPVLETGWFEARCRDRDGSEVMIDTRLLDTVQPGDWLLVFSGAGREILDAPRAAELLAALDALEAALDGRFDPSLHFADLTMREPTLPEHLQKALK